MATRFQLVEGEEISQALTALRLPVADFGHRKGFSKVSKDIYPVSYTSLGCLFSLIFPVTVVHLPLATFSMTDNAIRSHINFTCR